MYTIYHNDTCLPDYFSGHHLPVVQVSVNCESTYHQIKDELLCYQSIDHLDEIDFDDYKQAVEELFESIDDLEAIPKCVLGIESSEDEDYDSVYMYFVIETQDIE